MSWFFEHLEVLIIVSAVLLLFVLLAWMYSHRRRRAQMLLHSEHDLYEDNYLEEKVYGSGSSDDPFFDEQVFSDTGEWEQTVKPASPTAPPEPESPPQTVANAEPEAEPEADVAETTHHSKPDDEELIIALFVVAPQGQVFYGLDLFSVFEELGMRYGHMKIYHHYGLGELKVEEPIFSVANLMEPGTFDPSSREEFNTPGVAMFMRLPGPFGGRVALELLLNSAQKLAAQMEGQVVNDRRQVLDQKLIEQLRHKITQFELQAA